MMTFAVKKIKDFISLYTLSAKYSLKNNMNILCAFIFVFIALPATVNAHQYKLGDLEIIHPWTRVTPKGSKVSSGYLYIINHSDTPDRLIAVSTNRAQETEIHSMTITTDIMQMKKISNGIEIPGKGEITLKPGGHHIMFMGISQPFQQNEKINAKLIFEKAGTIDVDFFVNAIGVKPSSK
ncbi:copper chaperone PCu(A)C [Bartonella clarridgeiae]|uniref:copper chaperone PCu(A)C n=1 Tax=Bartonella clarridgeiae TaxID=56426 RepID=UPI00047E2345|nr:copper chaperone PCu(A)C [Bartonella clarridgeiae]